MSRVRYLKQRRILIERGQWRGLTSVIGVQRRLRALAALGWSWHALAVEAGMTARCLQRLATAERQFVQPRTYDRISDLYDRLSLTPGPSSRTRAYARRTGWAPPLAWDDQSIDDPAAEPYRDQYVSASERGIDEIAVQEAMRGRRVHLYPAEKAEALRRLTERGYSAAAIADRLGTTQRSVVRTRSARGIRGAA